MTNPPSPLVAWLRKEADDEVAYACRRMMPACGECLRCERRKRLRDAAAEIERLKHNATERKQLIERQRAEIEMLEGIVARLPETADGVRVTPGMTLWEWVDGDFEAGQRSGWTQFVVESVTGSLVFCEEGERPATDCYSTLEAALARKESK